MTKLNLFVLITLFLTISCKQNSEDTNNGSPAITNTEKEEVTERVKSSKSKTDSLEKRQKEIDVTKFYMDNWSMVDDYGITYKLKNTKLAIDKRLKYESDKIPFDGNQYVIVRAYEVDFKYYLRANGELQYEIPYLGYILETKRSDTSNSSTYCNDSYDFIPDLLTDMQLKKLIAEFTGLACGIGERGGNEVRRERITAIKASGMIGDHNIPVKKAKIEEEEVQNEKATVSSSSKKFIITEDNLRVRVSSDLNAEKIENLPLNSVVTYLNEKSENKTTVQINNEDITDFWYKIKTEKGNIGWIHGCCFNE